MDIRYDRRIALRSTESKAVAGQWQAVVVVMVLVGINVIGDESPLTWTNLCATRSITKSNLTAGLAVSPGGEHVPIHIVSDVWQISAD